MVKKTIEQVQQENQAHFMEGGSRLSYGYQIYVVAKDTKKNKVLLGGLGAMGVGEMWFNMDVGPDSQRPGWEEALEREAPERSV